MKSFFEVFKEKPTCTHETGETLLPKIVNLLESKSPIYRREEKQINIEMTFYANLKILLSEGQKNKIEKLFTKKLAVLKRLSKGWNYSNSQQIEEAIKNQMSSQQGILLFFIKEWCLFMEAKLNEINNPIENKEANMIKLYKKIHFMHKNLLVFLQFMWETCKLAFQQFFIEYKKENNKDVNKKKIQRRMLSDLTQLKPFEPVYREFIKETSMNSYVSGIEGRKQEFQQALKTYYGIEENYEKLFEKKFQQIRKEYHENPSLRGKFKYICQLLQFFNKIEKQQGQFLGGGKNNKEIKPFSEEVILKLITHILQVCLPETKYSAIYVDIILAVHCQTPQWSKQNLPVMNKQLGCYFKLFFHQNLVSHYQKLRQASGSK